MRNISADLQSKLDTGVTTLARAWIITCADGTVLGCTDHDEDLMVNGVMCRADAAFVSGELDISSGLEISTGGWTGALHADGLTESDLAIGRYDSATVAAYLVDWMQPQAAVLLWAGVLGDIRRNGSSFEAELKSPSAGLSGPIGRIYSRTCDADLGDQRCGVNLGASAHSGSGEVIEIVAPHRIIVSGLTSFMSGHFSRGAMTWTQGNNRGGSAEVVNHIRTNDRVILEILEPSGAAIAPDDTFSIQAGCDKSFATCRSKFANQENFRGFPHMPGDDLLQAAPATGQRHDGASRNG